MAETFGDIWNRARLRCSSVPPALVREFALDAYRELSADRRWGFLRATTQLQTRARRTVTATFTLDSTSVTSAGAFLVADEGRQIRIGNNPVYTVADVVSANQITLDQAYAQGGTAGSQTATILDAYVAMPEDFGAPYTILNPVIQRPMPWWYSSDWLDLYDPNRIQSDSSARLIAAKKVGTVNVTGVLRRVLYEWYPYPTGAYGYPLTYFKRPDRLADTDYLQGALASRGDLLVTGILLRAAEYPGTVEQKNPYFNLALADRLRRTWTDAKQDLATTDDDQFPYDIEQVDWTALNGLFPGDTRILRQTDASVADYLGGGMSGLFGY